MRHSLNCKKSFTSTLTLALSSLSPFGNTLASSFHNDPLRIANAPMPLPESESFVKDYAAYSLCRKFDGLETNTDTAQVAITKWLESEERCRARNELSWNERNARAALHFAVQRKISSILGAFDPTEFFSVVDHSGGASTQRTRSTSAVENKESDCPDVTIGAKRLLNHVNREMGYYATPRIRNYSRFATVPKDSKTDRPILIENQGNMFLQKGIGTMIRDRLRKVGINLNKQERNQRLASDLSNATIDLSSASDSIATSLVFDLLPSDWCDVVFATRTPFVKLPGRNDLHLLEKIGGMGNGFVFELESLIFYAICISAIELNMENGPVKRPFVSVYGDDIIVDTTNAVLCIDALTYFGFTINTEKSYWQGPFRESCGKHYHNGVDCTPVYIKHFDGLPSSWYHLYNSLMYLGERIGHDFSRALRKIEHILRENDCFNYVPPSYGLTSGIHTVAYHPTKGVFRKRRVHGYVFKYYTFKTREYKVCQLGAYLRALRKPSRPTDAIHIVKPYGLYVIPPILELSEGYIKQGKKKNLRVSSTKGDGRFAITETSVWL